MFSKLLLRLLRKLEKTLAMKFVWQVASPNPFKDCKPTVLAQISPVATIGVARGTKGPWPQSSFFFFGVAFETSNSSTIFLNQFFKQITFNTQKRQCTKTLLTHC